MTKKVFIKRANVPNNTSPGEYGWDTGVYAFEDPIEIKAKRAAARERNRVSASKNAKRKAGKKYL